jgi:hypothetical protein
LSGLAGGAIVANQEFDVARLVGTVYLIVVEPNHTGSGTRVGSIMPDPGARQPAPVNGAVRPVAPPRPPSAPARPEEKFWVVTSADEGVEPVAMTRPELAKWMADNGYGAEYVQVCRDGTQDWRTAAAFNFPESIPW